MESLRQLLQEQAAVLTRSRTGLPNFSEPHCRFLNERDVLTPRQGAEETALHLFCCAVLDGGEGMCKSPGTAVCQGMRAEKNNKIRL